MSSQVTLRNMTSVGSASQEQLDYVTSKLMRHPISIKDQHLQDRKTLESLNVTAQQIADKCLLLYLKAMDLLKRPSEFDQIPISAIIDGKFKVKGFVASVMCTPVPCPMTIEKKHPCGFSGRHFVIKNLRTKEVLRISTLQLHIIRDHEFFCRSNTPLRIDPAFAQGMLEIMPGIDYSKEITFTAKWFEVNQSFCSQAHKTFLENSFIEKTTINRSVSAFLMSTKKVESEPLHVTAGEDDVDLKNNSVFDWRSFTVPLEPLEEDPVSDLDDTDAKFLHVTAGEDGADLKNISIFDRNIDEIFIGKDTVSVFKQEVEKSAKAGPEDHLKFKKLEELLQS